MLPRTLTELRSSSFGQDFYRNRTIKDEMRINLMRKLEAKDPIFTGIVGYEETVVPQVVNAILSRHNMILLGLRGQAKSRILRGLVEFLDDAVPVIEGCEINDDPFSPICRRCRDLIQEMEDRTWLRKPRSARDGLAAAGAEHAWRQPPACAGWIVWPADRGRFESISNLSRLGGGRQNGPANHCGHRAGTPKRLIRRTQTRGVSRPRFSRVATASRPNDRSLHSCSKFRGASASKAADPTNRACKSARRRSSIRPPGSRACFFPTMRSSRSR